MVKRVRKLLYELSGQGVLFKGDERLLDISYDLKFFQEVIFTGGEERITGLTDFAGSLLPGDQYQLAMLVGDELILQMEDGRCLEVTVVSNQGNLHKRGEIYKCDGSP
ncbi:MAG: hypothetical protein V3T61_06165 [Acidobacteriota bacterium]